MKQYTASTQSNDKLYLLSSAPVPKALMALGLPIMLGMLINALYNLADAFFVAGLGEIPMAAISVVFPLGQVIVGLGLMFGNGAASYLSRQLGRGDTEAADKTASTALYCSLLAGAFLIFPAALFLRPVLTLLGATATILPSAAAYGRIYVPAAIFNVFNVTMNNIVTSEGAPKTAMGALITGAVLNICLDPLFICVFGMGVTGAAAATAISQGVSSLVYIRYILCKRSVFTFSIKRFHPERRLLAEILKIGVPTLIFQLLTSLSIALINQKAGSYGDAAIAAMGAVTRVTSMGTLAVFGFLKGFQPLAGFSFGAKNFDRLHASVRASVAWSTGFCVTAGLLMALLSGPIVSLFADGGGDMVLLGQRALTASGLAFCLFGFHTVYACLFLALGRARAGLFLGACRQGICFIPAILLLPALWDINGVLYAQPVADVLSAVITAVMALRLHRELAAAASAGQADSGADEQTDGQADDQTVSRKNGQTDYQTDSRAASQADREAYDQADHRTDCGTNS